ncbi:MAG: hypothetical protein ACK58X_02620 [Planctomycetota bacterium]
MNNSMIRTWAGSLALSLAMFAACGGGKAGVDAQSGRPSLVNVEIGRVVDVYAYRRATSSPTDGSAADRRERAKRELVLIERDAVISANLATEPLFDAAGNEVASADYEFLPFDKTVGHEELLILWDDRATGLPQGEDKKFSVALAAAKSGLTAVPASFRGQNTLTRPIPIVPRNAALRLTFSGPIPVDQQFLNDNPAAIQLLEFKGDPAIVDPANAFRILPYRAITSGNTIVLDTTIQGREAGLAGTTSGMPLSADNVTANIRIAIPTRGVLSPLFYIQNDAIPQLNGDDSVGRASVIRDFRSGNLIDGEAGRLREPERPSILGSFAMGIAEVDLANNRVRLVKRGITVPVRGRYPFVDGPLSATAPMRPLGPLSVPTRRPLLRGDILSQTVQVGAETIELRSEILINESINTVAGSTGIGLATSPPVGDSGQGELITSCWVRLQSGRPGRDSAGNAVGFVADNSTPDGRDCVLKAIYHENVPFAGGSTSAVSDRNWRNLFPRIDPRPATSTQDVQPNASVAVEFTKPMDLDQVDSTTNLLVTSRPTSLETFAQQLSDPKRAKSRIVPTRLTDLNGDGTVLRLQPQLGFHHRAGVAEAYAVHVRLGASGVLDLAGNTLDVFDDPSNPVGSWSVDFSLDPSAAANLSGWFASFFEADDEDGTLPGSVDIFGQFRRENGRLVAAPGVRLSRSADGQSLGTISRISRGECWDPRNPVNLPGPPPTTTPTTANSTVAPAAPLDQQNNPHPGRLYWQPTMFDQVAPPAVPQVYEYFQTQNQKVGRVLEPLKPQGSRMQLRYLEDDFQLSYRQPTDFGLDVEQLYWSPFNDETVLFDVFDRVSMSLSHSRRRTDEKWELGLQAPAPPAPQLPAGTCNLIAQSMNSSLSPVFSDNVLEGTQQVPVFEDKVYTINPNQALRVGGTNFVPYPRFDRSYTWRDSRLVTVDGNGNVIGLGGAQQPDALAPNDDRTANVDSPWIESVPLDRLANPAVADPEFFAAGNSTYVLDPADFDGFRKRDHDPIALPLLVDIKVFPDDAANGIASGANAFQMALLGPPSYGFAPWGGYYDGVAAGFPGRPRWPNTRVQASGGFDLINGNPILIDPSNQLTAATSIVKDAGYGAFTTALFAANPGDGMLPWARADFVRKVSTMTFGFFDTLQPQRAVFVDQAGATTSENGIPDLLAVAAGLRISDLVVQLDPPQARQPAGTSVVVEIRGADDFDRDDVLYNPGFVAPGFAPSDAFDTRGNLLNANYACEAYRYSTPNFTGGVPRITAVGLTRYVTEDQLALIRNQATDLLPRYLNVRVTMTNNVTVSPALSPSLRSLSIVYRVAGN